MDGVFEAATARAWPEEAMHREYFNVPEADAWVNRSFELHLLRSGQTLTVPPESSATEVLAQAGLPVATKCSDGLCGVCATAYNADQSGEIEHRDFVLSKRDREQKIILCCSRMCDEGATLTLDL